MLLLTIIGQDRPGVSCELFSCLSTFVVDILDIEQVTINKKLILGVHLSAQMHEVGTILSIVTEKMRQQEMRVEIDFLPSQQTAHPPEPSVRSSPETIPSTGNTPKDPHNAIVSPQIQLQRIIVMGRPLQTTAFGVLTRTLARHNINIASIRSLADYPITGIELTVESQTTEISPKVREELATLSRAHHVDIAVENTGSQRRAQRLIVFDVDSTLIQGEVIEMLAAHAGTEETVREITTAAMNGTIDFRESLTKRVETLAGLGPTVVDSVQNSLKLTPGARTTIRILRELGFKIGLVSGGFHNVIDPLAQKLAVDYVAANRLETREDGSLTGKLIGPIIDRAGKAAALEKFAKQHSISLQQTVAVGDGANDLDMLSAAGLGIAFCAKDIVAQKADTTLSYPYLDGILFLLGITRKEVASIIAAQNPQSGV